MEQDEYGRQAGEIVEERTARRIAPHLRLIDAATVTQGFMDRALDYCAEKLNLDSPQAALQLMRKGDITARSYSHRSLAEQAAEALATLDDNVVSAYVFDYEATPEDAAFAAPTESSPIHMIVQVKQKTQSLYALIGELEEAVVKQYASQVGPDQLKYLLNVQVIDAEDVRKRRGYAGLLSSLHNRPIEVWKR